MVYNRTMADGTVLTFGASGWTWHGIFVLQDYETGSLWFPGLSFAGGNDHMVCIAGPNQDEKVWAEESFRVSWKTWVGQFPGTLIMQAK